MKAGAMLEGQLHSYRPFNGTFSWHTGEYLAGTE